MAFNAGSIITSIGGDLAPLRSALAKAKEMAGEYGKSMGEKMGFAEIAAGVGSVISVGVAFEKVKHAMEEIGETGRAADRIGVTTEALIGLQYQAQMAGVSGEELSMSMMHMEKNLADAANGTGSAKAALMGLGLSVRDLVNMAPDQAMGKIADSMKDVTNAADKTNVEMALFGARSGTRLSAMLDEGSEGIARARAETEKLGISYSRVDAAKVEASNQAWIRVDKVLDGVAKRIGIEVAPYAEGLADLFVKAATEGGGIGPKVGAAMEWVAKGIATVADYTELLQAGYYELTAAGGYFINAAVQGFDKLAHVMDWVQQKMGGKAWDLSFLDGFAQGMDEQIDKLNAQANEHWGKFMDGTARKAVTSAFIDFKAASQIAADKIAADAERMKGSFKGVGAEATDSAKKIEEMMTGIRNDIAGVGMGEADKKLIEFKSLPGVSDTQVSQYAAMVDELRDKLKGKEITDGAKSYLEGLKTPLEKAIDMAKELNDAFNKGGITEDQKLKGLDALRKGLNTDTTPATGDNEPKFASLIMAGSSEAMKLAFSGSQQNDPKTALAQKQVDLLNQQVSLLQRMSDNQIELAYAETD